MEILMLEKKSEKEKVVNDNVKNELIEKIRRLHQNRAIEEEKEQEREQELRGKIAELEEQLQEIEEKNEACCEENERLTGIEEDLRK